MESRAAARKANRYMATPRAAPATKLPRLGNAIAAKTWPFKQGQSARILLFKPARPLGDRFRISLATLPTPRSRSSHNLASLSNRPIPNNQRKSAFSLAAGSGRTTTRARNRRDGRLVRGPARIARRRLRPGADCGRAAGPTPGRLRTRVRARAATGMKADLAGA